MPSTLSGTNSGASTIPQGYFAERVADDTHFRLATAAGRPWGVATAAIAAGAQGTLWANGQRSCYLAPGQTVTSGQRLVLVDGGMLRAAPQGHTGWVVGKALEGKTAGMTETALLVQVAPVQVS